MTIALGVDPALGGGMGIVAAKLGEHLTVLDAQVEYGFARTEQQLSFIQQNVHVYRPSLVVLEFDAQQRGLGNDERLAQLADRYNFRVQPHLTRGRKSDDIFGVASMDQSFARGEIRIPWGDEFTRHRMEPLVAQLRAWRPDVQTKHLTQDLVMALWFVWLYWQQVRQSAIYGTPTKQHRPPWVARDPRFSKAA